MTTLEKWKDKLVGETFSRLTVIDVLPYFTKDGKPKGYKAKCKCSCGNITETAISNIINGHTKSCGCLIIEASKETIKIANKKAQEWQKEHPDKILEIRRYGMRKAQEWHKEHPEESKNITEKMLVCSHKWCKEHPKEVKEITKKRLEKAHAWQRDHKSEFRHIYMSNLSKAQRWCKEHRETNLAYLRKANKKALKWQKEHPEEVKEITKKRLEGKKLWMLHHREEYLLSCQKRRLSLCSKEERDILNFLTSLKYPIERQYLVEGHSYDFKVGKFLIEYHGSFYHCSEYTNLNNPESNVSPKRYKSITYHQQLREVAIRNGFKLIQIWDYDWKNRKEFIQTLIKDQLNNIADYRDYLDEERLLNNDYGFIIDGQQVEPRGIWVSSSTHKQIVDESYNKGKFLVYNSGYTSYRLEDC